MKKDASVKLGSTRCDFCNDPATSASEITVTCDKCSLLIKSSTERTTLKAAGITLRDAHK